MRSSRDCAKLHSMLVPTAFLFLIALAIVLAATSEPVQRRVRSRRNRRDHERSA